MTDPLTVLNAEDPPVQPDPEFAARLRRKLESALSLPTGTRGVEMSGTTAALADLTDDVPSIPEYPRPAALPYLTVADARGAIAWYRDALGAELHGEPIVMDDGRIGHAELAIGDGVLYLADEFTAMGLRAPEPGWTSVSLMLHVPDTDAALSRARRFGAEIEREPYQAHGFRGATIRDPFGHRWMISGPVVELIRPGDIGYLSLHTPDVRLAAAFYGHVLGWSVDDDGQVTNTVEHIALSRGEGTLRCYYAVTDIEAARTAIIAAGGRAEGPRRFALGESMDATDPDGNPFAVYVPESAQRRPALNGAGAGELSYLTHEVADSAVFRDFYSALFGWTFEPGRVADGWQIGHTQPMAGVAGGAQRQTVVPMWTVTDIEIAVRRVRDAGGTVLSEPAQQSYGLMAECTDDQGGRFYLGQF
ncbi:glyoxalase [Mycolicibacterium anyangense]|uniref:Glyoxalase n=1 Tax=Mycolicibacterium anyangense TaxID=1431246 RepID=A0A6N4WIA3_9MYCO|nr:VOC family protein [Mycolicibacterium anyangense]BBZ79622.1 glyoxalase [Mycolicibacterium anyangense]